MLEKNLSTILKPFNKMKKELEAFIVRQNQEVIKQNEIADKAEAEAVRLSKEIDEAMAVKAKVETFLIS